MATSEVRVIVCPVGEPPRIDTVPDRLESFQEIVGGSIEGWGLPGGLFLICHGEGRLIGLPANRTLPNVGVVCGQFLITRNGRGGQTVSVRDADLLRVRELLS